MADTLAARGGRRRAALIIASYEFDDPKFRELRAPAHDAEQLAEVLSEPSIGDFDVRTLVNAPVEAVRQALEAFFSDRRPDDLLLVYFSGHGVKDPRGRLYFAMKNTSFESLRATGLEARFLSDQMEDSRSKRIVVLLDCCYSGAFLKGFRARGGEDVDVKEELEGRGRAVITASRSTEYAWEADNLVGSAAAPSVFTSALVRGLQTGEADRNGDGRITIDELYDFVFDHVREAVGAQTPGKWSDVEGELVIARNPAPPVPAADLPPELQRAVESDAALQRVGAVLELTNWLRSDDAPRVARARQLLEVLAEDPDRRVSDAAGSSLAVAASVVPEPLVEQLPDPEPSPTRERRPRRIRPALLALGAVVLISVAVAAFVATRGDKQGATPTTSTTSPSTATTPTTAGGFSGRPDRVMHFAGPLGCANLDRCLGRRSQELYGFQFQRVVENAESQVTTLALQSGDIDVGAMDARTADIANYDLVRLTDDKGLQPTSGLNVLGFYVTSKTAAKYRLVNMSDLTTKR